MFGNKLQKNEWYNIGQNPERKMYVLARTDIHIVIWQ